MSERPFTHASYRLFLTERRLMGSRCARCGAVYLPPRPICSACQSSEMEWVELPETGRLSGFSIIYAGPTAMSEAGYSREVPYCAGIVQLDAGPSISAQILGFDLSRPEEIFIGAPLRAEFVTRGQAENSPVVLAFQKIEIGEPF